MLGKKGLLLHCGGTEVQELFETQDRQVIFLQGAGCRLKFNYNWITAGT